MNRSPDSSGRRRTPDRDALTARERVFVRLVHASGNHTQAYLDSGYRCSRATAAVNAARLLRKARVQGALAALAAERVDRLDQQGDEELELAAQLMRFTVLDLYDAAGVPIPIHLLPGHVAAAIKGIRPSAHRTVLEFHDKLRPIELPLRAFGRLTDKHQVEVGTSLERLLALAAEPVEK